MHVPFFLSGLIPLFGVGSPNNTLFCVVVWSAGIYLWQNWQTSMSMRVSRGGGVLVPVFSTCLDIWLPGLMHTLHAKMLNNKGPHNFHVMKNLHYARSATKLYSTFCTPIKVLFQKWNHSWTIWRTIMHLDNFIKSQNSDTLNYTCHTF